MQKAKAFSAKVLLLLRREDPEAVGPWRTQQRCNGGGVCGDGFVLGQRNGLKGVGCEAQARKPVEGLFDVVGFKPSRTELATQLWQFGAAVAAPEMLVDVNEYLEHGNTI